MLPAAVTDESERWTSTVGLDFASAFGFVVNATATKPTLADVTSRRALVLEAFASALTSRSPATSSVLPAT